MSTSLFEHWSTKDWTLEQWNRVTDRLRAARMFAGLDLPQVADLLRRRGEPFRTQMHLGSDLADMEARQLFPRPALLAALCDLYGVDPDALTAEDMLERAKATDVGRAILASKASTADQSKLLQLVAFLRQKGPVPESTEEKGS